MKYMFKGISKQSGMWVIGGYIYDPHTDKHFIATVRENEEDVKTEVREETLSMSTGLYDSNGKLVFENDVLKGEVPGKERYLKLVSLKNGCFYVLPDKLIGNNISDFLSVSSSIKNDAKCEVIANIHDPDYTESKKGALI